MEFGFYRRSIMVCWSVCLSVMIVIPEKTAEAIEMPFGMCTRVSPRNHVFDGSPDPPWGHGKGQFRVDGASLCKVYGIPYMCGSDAAFYQITLTTCSVSLCTTTTTVCFRKCLIYTNHNQSAWELRFANAAVQRHADVGEQSVGIRS